MFIDRILAPIETLGPGARLVIWTKGCSKHCAGCANPELWDTKTAKKYATEDILRIIDNIYRENPFDGITISGGDPLEQKEEMLELLEKLNRITDDILVYTGYTLNQLIDIWDSSEIDSLKNNIAVLIDGPYIESLNFSDVVLRGSGNQKIHIFKEKYREIYDEYLTHGRKIQNVYMGNRLISVGIHDRRDDEIEET